MKRALLTFAAVAVALPLLAEEPAKKTETRPQPVNLTAAPPAGQQDSPLVAAARRTNRLGKKPTNVITNSNLKKASDAHITTTENQRSLQMPVPVPTMEEQQALKREEERKKLEAAQKVAREREARRTERKASAAYRAEEGMHDSEEADAEAAGERDLQRANEQKPPQF